MQPAVRCQLWFTHWACFLFLLFLWVPNGCSARCTHIGRSVKTFVGAGVLMYSWLQTRSTTAHWAHLWRTCTIIDGGRIIGAHLRAPITFYYRTVWLPSSFSVSRCKKTAREKREGEKKFGWFSWKLRPHMARGQQLGCCEVPTGPRHNKQGISVSL